MPTCRVPSPLLSGHASFGNSAGMFDEPLLATCWTTAGDAASDRPDLRSPLPLLDRIAAAAAAGFRGFGLLHDDLVEAERTYTLPGIATMLADHGITELELEGIDTWWSPERSGDARAVMLRAAEALGARHLKVTPHGGAQPPEFERYVTEFASLAAQSADVGARFGIEFLPWTSIATVDDALALVEAAGHPAGGIIVDLWHVARAHTPAERLASIPPERLVGVELDDADAEVVGTMLEDTVHRRRYCGQGAFDLPAMIGALRAAGWHGPWGVEILSTEHRALPVDQACRRAFDTAIEVLAPVR